MEQKNVTVIMICPSRHSDEAREYAREQLTPAGFTVDDDMVIDFSDVFPGNDDKTVALEKFILGLEAARHSVLGDGRFWGLMGIGGVFSSANEDGVRKHPLVAAILRFPDDPEVEMTIDYCYDK